jgi:ABC-2 type transport system permease protein
VKKILAVISRDIKSGTRDWLIIYLAIAPILIALILKALIPSVGDSMLNVAVLEQTPQEIQNHLSKYAKIILVESEEDLEERVLRMDEVFGLRETPQGLTMVVEGNESEYMVQLFSSVVDQYRLKDQEINAEVITSDMGWQMSPLKLQGAIIVIIFSTILGGMLIVLNIVEEKMSNTMSALHVTPISKTQIVIGKGFLGFFLSIFGSFAAVFILGFEGINYGMLGVTVFSIAWISMIIGFGIGVVNNEPISAIASMKITFVPVLASVFGAIYLPTKWVFVLYWSPFYWAYLNIHNILMQAGEWPKILMNNGMILVITCLVFMALKSRIKRGLN